MAKYFVLGLFILAYVFIISLPKYKTYIALIVAILSCLVLIISEGFTTNIFGFIDYNVLLMLFGIMIIVGLFIESKMPAKLADMLITKIPNALICLVIVCIISGVVSAFIDNVATVLMLAPIGLAMSKKLNISPIPVIISISVSSNLQGAATLVGDTTSIMLGGFADMSFFDFFFLDGKISIFWAVEFGMLLTIPVLFFIFRKNNKKIILQKENIQTTTLVPSILLILTILCLILFSFVENKLAITNGLICTTFGLIALIYYVVKFKGNVIKTITKSVDFSSLIFLTSLFVVIGVVEKVGIIADISKIFASIGSNNVFLLYTIIVFGSVLVSAFIDNIPYVATMLPVIKGLLVSLPTVSPYLLYFGLLCGATLGGNLTPVGASANVVGIGILNKEGYNVRTTDFLKIGVPFTLMAVLGGYALVWFVWGM